MSPPSTTGMAWNQSRVVSEAAHVPEALVQELLRLLRRMPENLSEHVQGGDDDVPLLDLLDEHLVAYELSRLSLLQALEALLPKPPA